MGLHFLKDQEVENATRKKLPSTYTLLFGPRVHNSIDCTNSRSRALNAEKAVNQLCQSLESGTIVGNHTTIYSRSRQLYQQLYTGAGLAYPE